MRRAPAVLAFVAVAIGVTVADLSGWPASWWTGLLLAALIALGWAARRRRGLAIAALAVFGLLGAHAAAWRGAPPPVEGQCGAEAGWQARVAGPVTRLPEADGAVAQRFAADLVAEQCGAHWRPRSGRVQLTSWSGPELRRGDLLQVRLRLSPLAVARNPTDADEEMRARRAQLSARAKPTSGHVLVEGGRGPLAALDQWRHAAARGLEAALTAPAAGVAKAVALGDRGGIAPAQRELWARAGIAHLLAISGLHVAFVTGLVFALWRLLFAIWPGLVERLSARRLAAAVTVPAALVYCLAAGAPPSAVRATTMAVAFLVGVAVGRPSAGVNALGLAGLVILGVDPTSLYDPGFLLSFAAVSALLLAPRLPPVRGWRRVGRYLAGAALASVAATLATAPISASLFGSVSLIAPLANLAAVPLGAGIATPAAILHALVSPWAPALAAPLAALLELALALLDGLAGVAGTPAGAALNVPAPRGVEIAAYYVLVGSAVLLLRRRRVAVPLAVAALALLAALALRVVESRGDGQLTLIHPYVGQGEATVAILPRGAVMVFDAGGSERGRFDPGREVIAPLLRRQGVGRIALGVISHPHPDHVGGWRYLIEHFPVDELWWSGAEPDEPMQAQVLAAARRRGTRVRTTLELPPVLERDGVTIEVLHPRDREALAAPQLNDVSVVLRLRHGERSVLLTGDIGVAVEQALAARLQPTDAFKSPHHGSRSSSSPALLAALSPGMVVISVGEDNAYGLPDPEVLARYAAAGVQIWRTDHDGAVTMVSDGRRWRVHAFRRGRSVD